MKKLFAVLLALALIMSLATTAFAATVINDTTHAYKAYQIFSGNQDANSAVLGNVQWGNGVDGSGLLAALKAKNPTLYSAVTSAAGVAGILAISADNMNYLDDAKEFANVAVNHVVEANGYDIAAGDTSVDLPAGYYLIVDATEVGENDAKNPALLQVTHKGDIHIQQKYNVPTVEKKIDVEGQLKDVDEVSIGDKVTFQLKAVLPNNLEHYTTYKLVFHDQLSAGLTLDDTSVAVSYGASDISSYCTVSTGLAHCTKDASTECSLEIAIADVKAIPGIVSNGVIQVTYTAVLDEDALVNQANTNRVQLEYSNDPNWEATPADPNPPTGVTPWDEVEIYTTEVSLVKKDGTNGNILTGAEFRITGEAANIVITTNAQFVAYPTGASVDPTNCYWKLNDGTYTATDPGTAGVDTGKYVDTAVSYYKQITEAVAPTKAATPVEAKAYVGDDGVLSFTGLGVGTYTITETKTPAGYNTVQPITLTVTFDEATKTFGYSWGGGIATSTQASVVVFNNQGSTLPETGGMGTTIFYIFGAILAAGAAILLVTQKRMSAAE